MTNERVMKCAGRWFLAGMFITGVVFTGCSDDRAEARLERPAVRQSTPTSSNRTRVVRGAVTIERTAPQEVLVGKSFSYTIKVTNGTGARLDDVVLTERLPNEFTLGSTLPKASVAGNVATWNLGKMESMALRQFTVNGKARETGVLLGCADVACKIPPVCRSVNVVQPALRITKTAPAEVILCDAIPIRIVVTNTGTGPASNVIVRDALPDGVTTVDGKETMRFSAGTLAPKASRDFAIRAKASRPGTFVNRATVTADDGLSASSADVTTVVRQPVLAVTKTGPTIRFIGRPLTYTITVTNRGDAPARDAVLTDTLSNLAQFVRASDNGVMADGRVTWQLGTLAPGGSKSVTLDLKAVAMGELRNTVVASAYCAKASAETKTTIKGIPAILLECVDQEDPIEVGTNETYTITVTNQGTAVGTNIVITCQLPVEQEFVSATGPTQETVSNRTVTFAALPSLAAKAQAVYRIVVKGVKSGDVRFRVTLTSDQAKTVVEETESTHIYD